MKIIHRPIATFYVAPETDAGGAATLEPPTKEPVTEPGKTSLGQAWKTAMKQQDASAKVGTDESHKVEETKIETKVELTETEKKIEADKAAAAAKKVSPLDVVLDPTKIKVEAAPVAEEIPANAPAKTLREAYERQKAEAAKWKAEVEKAAKGDPAISAKLETLQQEREKLAKENAELREAITVVNVDLDPEVRRKYHDGKASLVKNTVQHAAQFGADEKMFAEALALPQGKARTTAIRDALAEVDEMDRPAIYNKLAKISDLEDEHAELLKNSQHSYAELSKKRQEQMTQRQQETERAKLEIFDKATKGLSAKNPTIQEVPESVEGHKDWNERLKADHAAGLRLLSPEATLEEISAAAVKGARYDFVESLLLDERKESASLRERLAKYEGAEPGFDGRQRVEKTSKLDKTPSQLYKEKMEELRGKHV